jgi:hypothetical protein
VQVLRLSFYVRLPGMSMFPWLVIAYVGMIDDRDSTDPTDYVLQMRMNERYSILQVLRSCNVTKSSPRNDNLPILPSYQNVDLSIGGRGGPPPEWLTRAKGGRGLGV